MAKAKDGGTVTRLNLEEGEGTNVHVEHLEGEKKEPKVQPFIDPRDVGDDLEADAGEDLADILFSGHSKRKKKVEEEEEVKEEPKEEVEDEKPADGEVEGDAKTTEAKEEKDTKEEDAPKTTKDDDRLASALHRLAEATEKNQPAPERQPPPAPRTDDGLSDLDRRAYAVLAEEQRYRGRDLAKEQSDWETKVDSYQAKWEKEHPEDEFDEEDKEHRKFFRQNPPPVDEDDFREARATARVLKSTNQALESERTQRLIERVTEVSAHTVESGKRELVKALGAESVEGLKAKDKLVALATREVMPEVEGMLSLASEIPFMGLNPQRHQAIMPLVESIERVAMANPQSYGGRRFATLEAASRMNQAERDKVWTITDIRGYLPSQIVKYGEMRITARTKELKEYLADSTEDKPAKETKEKETVKAELKKSSKVAEGAGNDTVTPVPGSKAKGGVFSDPAVAERNFFGS